MKTNQHSIICPYEHYYTHQAGSGVGVIYKGALHQRGHGIGSFLGGLFRSVLPLISGGAKAIGKEALNAGVGLLKDMAATKPMEESIKNRFREASSNLKRRADNKLDSLMSGSGYKSRKRVSRRVIHSKTSNRNNTKKNKNKINDIFVN